MQGREDRPRPWRRLVVTAFAVGAVAAGTIVAEAIEDEPHVARPVPEADCGPGSRPETGLQGRVPKADYESGRAERGYLCNTRTVGHSGKSGGFKTLRYVDDSGRVCAYYDSNPIAPRDILGGMLEDGLGVVALDMSDPRKPRRTANLITPAMLAPHESLLVHQGRGLLMAGMGTAATAPGFVDIYDVSQDCRHPRLLSTTPSALFGHESGLSPDGRTFWVAGAAGGNLVALDIADPRRPRIVFSKFGVIYHGLRFSPDGDTMYVANIGSPGAGGILDGGGLRIYDVSEVHARTPDPEVRLLSELTWPEVSIPQSAEPFSVGGRDYVLETDEFIDLASFESIGRFRTAPVGAARIIDVTNPRRPEIVSDIRLQVHEPRNRTDALFRDPGNVSPAQGYAAHYCSVPTRKNPGLVACSMILSGLRVFDVRDPERPREVAYFNRPTPPRVGVVPEAGSYAMSRPAWDVRNQQIWYTDVHTGFWVVKLTNGVGRLLGR
ncbi:LVIVD repeat-containing protein [Nocardioides stalactiti]|uniref:LVIVD repeat-containing protein n=1 Tax=Nocardioides stalactiti TaxID=2755356 RepID=UPI001603A246|nr:hypothetical protein [Nocardioides stalactiti]